MVGSDQVQVEPGQRGIGPAGTRSGWNKVWVGSSPLLGWCGRVIVSDRWIEKGDFRSRSTDLRPNRVFVTESKNQKSLFRSNNPIRTVIPSRSSTFRREARRIAIVNKKKLSKPTASLTTSNTRSHHTAAYNISVAGLAAAAAAAAAAHSESAWHILASSRQQHVPSLAALRTIDNLFANAAASLCCCCPIVALGRLSTKSNATVTMNRMRIPGASNERFARGKARQ